MSKITWKAGTMEYPLPPVMVSCGTIEKPNIMTAAWTGIINSEPPMTYVSIRPERYSHDIIKESGEFVINLPTTKLLTAVDFCGVKSGKDMNKFKELKLRAGKCSQVAAPQILESPVSLECKVKDVVSYGSHDMFVAEIVAVNVDDALVDENGKLCLEKADLVAYVHNGYYTLGRKVGFFGFSVCRSAMLARKKMENVVVEVKERKLPAKKTFDKKAKPARRDDRKRFFKDDRKPFGGRKRSPIKKKA
jgi:flavin reductase (DIM6/NTAB) family NADH-FMN oxidoreductase RutF